MCSKQQSKIFNSKQTLSNSDLLQLVLDNNPFPIALVDTNDEHIFYWSKSAIKLFGHHPSSTEEWYKLAYPDPQYRQDVIKRWKPYLKLTEKSTDTIYTGEYNITCQDGSVKVCELFVQRIPNYLIVTLNDLTKQKQVISDLQESTDRFQSLFENNPLPTYLWQHVNNDFVLRNYNKAAHDITDSKIENIIGVQASDMYKNDTRILAYFHEAYEKQTSISCEIDYHFKTTQKNKYLNCKFSFIPPDSLMIVTEDITDKYQFGLQLQSANQQLRANNQQLSAGEQQLRATNQQLHASEQQLRISEKRYRRSEEIGHVGNWEYHIDTKHFWGSDEAKRIYGFNTDALDFSTEHVESCIPERKRVHQALIDLIEKNKPYDLEFEIRTKDTGEKKYIHSIAELEKNKDGKPVKVSGVIIDISHRKKAEDEIKIREMHLRSLIENPIGYLIYRTQLNRESDQIEVVQVSPSFTQVLGLRDEDRDHFNTWFTHVHPEDLPRLLKASENGMKPPFKLQIDVRYNHPTEGTRWFNIRSNGIPFADNPNLIEYANGIILDITDRKLAEEQLKENQAQLKNIVENSTNMFYAHSKDHILTFVSPQVREYLGCEPEEAKKQWTQFATDNPINQKAFALTQKAIDTGERQPTYELELRRTDGRNILVEVREAPLIENGIVTGIVGSLADITERKRNEEKINNISRRLKIATESANIGIWELDLKKNILTWDKQMFALYGIEQDTFGGAYDAWKQGVHPDDIDRSDAEVQNAIAGNRDFHTQFRIVWPDGHIRFIEAHAIVTRDPDGTPNSMIGVNWDITEQKNAENDLIKAKEKAEESDRLKSAFLANMSHEIRTPMNGILGFTSLLQKSDLSGETREQYIEIIKKSGARMLDTVNDLITISKIETGQEELHYKQEDPCSLLEEIVEFFKPSANKKGLEFNFEHLCTSKHDLVQLDATKFNSIVSNLIRNAIKFTDSGNITITSNKDDKNIMICVKDTGHGIPEDRQEAIFDRFVQADVSDKDALEGSGLGLCIVKAYVEMMGGNIHLESELGKGTCFTVQLPIIKIDSNDKKSVKTPPDKTKIELNKILIAEDDDISYQHLSICLEPYVHNILHAVNGEEAVQMAKEHLDLDLILMDIKMPKLDGYEATKKIRAFNKNIPIICQTAYALHGDKEKSLDAGCNGHVSKPINIEELLLLIAESMGA